MLCETFDHFVINCLTACCRGRLCNIFHYKDFKGHTRSSTKSRYDENLVCFVQKNTSLKIRENIKDKMNLSDSSVIKDPGVWLTLLTRFSGQWLADSWWSPDQLGRFAQRCTVKAATLVRSCAEQLQGTCCSSYQLWRVCEWTETLSLFALMTLLKHHICEVKEIFIHSWMGHWAAACRWQKLPGAIATVSHPFENDQTF